MWCHYTFVVYLFMTTVILEEFAEVDAIAEGSLNSIGVRLAPPCCQLDHCTNINWEICKRTIGSCVGYCALIEVSQCGARLKQGCFLTRILSTVKHLVLIVLEFLEFLVEFF